MRADRRVSMMTIDPSIPSSRRTLPMYIEQLIGITSRAVCAGFGTPGKALAHASDRDAPCHGARNP